jgi:Fibronectin type III domain/NHL repeat
VVRKFALVCSVVVGLVGSLAVGQSSVALVSVGGISVVAGSTGFGSSGDGGPATAATFRLPMGLAVDGGGNVYVADVVNDVVRKVGTDGVISTVAGSAGNAGFSGDGGQATNATLNEPWGIAVDGPGNLYIADLRNNRVRKVGTDGVISTVAGNGLFFSGFDPLSDGGPATSATINPLGVAVDGLGELFITDSNDGRVRKVDTGGVISTVAGNGTSSFSGDGGPATAAGLDLPLRAVAVDASGVLYIAGSSSRIRKVGTDGVISTVVGNGTAGFSGDGGPATAAQISESLGLAVDGSGTLYLTDQANHRVRRVTPAGVISTVAGTGVCANADGVPGIATSAGLCDVDGMAVDRAGTPFFTDENHLRIYKLGASVPSAPSGVTATAGNAVAVVSWTIPASDGGSPITGYTAIASPGGASCTTAGATTCTVPGLTNGTAYTFTVTAVSAVGSSMPSNPSTTITPVAPDVTAPTVSAAATPVFSIRSVVSLTYSGADAGTGIANFDVRYRRAPYNAGFGALAFPASWQHTTARSVSVAAVKGSTFCLSVRSRDKAGNVSGWSGERCTAVALDDRSLVASRGWSRRTGSVYYAGTITSIARGSANLTRTGVRARRLGIVAVRCRGCGTVGIYWNGRLIRKVSLNATTTAYRQVISIVDFGATRPGTLVIRTLTTGRVQIDGLASSRT